MASYNPIANSEVDPESPISSSLISRLRDNPLAIQEGDPSAPNIVTNALADQAVTLAKLNPDVIQTAVGGDGISGNLQIAGSGIFNWVWIPSMATDEIVTLNWSRNYPLGPLFAIAGINLAGAIGSNVQRNSVMNVMGYDNFQVTVRHEGTPGSGDASGFVWAYGI